MQNVCAIILKPNKELFRYVWLANVMMQWKRTVKRKKTIVWQKWKNRLDTVYSILFIFLLSFFVD